MDKALELLRQRWDVPGTKTCLLYTSNHEAQQFICFPDILRQTFQSLVPQFLRHPVKSFGNAAGDAGKGVAVFSFTPDAASENRNDRASVQSAKK